MLTLPCHWVDGIAGDLLPLPDRGLDYGDGLFETLRLERGQLQLVEYHLDRLLCGCRVLGFPEVLTEARAQLQSVCSELASAGIKEAMCRLTVTRGSGQRGYAPPDQCTPRIVITASATRAAWGEAGAPLALCLCATRCSQQPALAGLKHLNRLEQVLAAAEVSQLKVQEGLMLDMSGLLISATSANVFLVVEGELLTPSLDECGVAGTLRRFIIETLAPAQDMTVRIASIRLDTLYSASEVFLTNSAYGIHSVGQLGEHTWSDFPVAELLRRQMLTETEAMCSA